MKDYLICYKYIIIFILILSIVCIYFFINKTSKVEISETVLKEEIQTEKLNNIITETVKVDIKGSIVNPGVYELDTNKRVIDVINEAGGLTKDADTTLLNLSKKLTDEMIIKIYSKAEIKNYKEKNTQTIIKYIETDCTCPDTVNDACINENIISEEINEQTNQKISINIATITELDSLPGIGESKANDIINYRNSNGFFKTIEDIKNVSGIGDSLFEKIKDRITI